METYIHNYIYNKKNQRVGVVVAKVDDNPLVGIGWSKCNTSLGDRFDRERGLKIALGRADFRDKNYPRSVAPYIEQMAVRATKYFKNRSVIV